MAKKIIDVNETRVDGYFFTAFRSNRYDFRALEADSAGMSEADLLRIGIGVGYMIAADDNAEVLKGGCEKWQD